MRSIFLGLEERLFITATLLVGQQVKKIILVLKTAARARNGP
jgi:hypothetical protein